MYVKCLNAFTCVQIDAFLGVGCSGSRCRKLKVFCVQTFTCCVLCAQVSGPQRDLHSGNDGGVFCEPMMDLVKVMSSLLEPGTTTIRVSRSCAHRYTLTPVSLVCSFDDIAPNVLSSCKNEE